MGIEAFVTVYIRFFFIYTPFFILAVFLALTSGYPAEMKRELALRVTAGITVVSAFLFLCGGPVFSLLGITLDAFRIGAGALLFLSAVSLTNGRFTLPKGDSIMDMAVVPLAIPVTIGPGSVGALMVQSGAYETWLDKATSLMSITCAGVTVGVVLVFAEAIQNIIGARGISMLSKLTGLVLAALSCQMIMTGVKGFLA